MSYLADSFELQVQEISAPHGKVNSVPKTNSSFAELQLQNLPGQTIKQQGQSVSPVRNTSSVSNISPPYGQHQTSVVGGQQPLQTQGSVRENVRSPVSMIPPAPPVPRTSTMSPALNIPPRNPASSPFGITNGIPRNNPSRNSNMSPTSGYLQGEVSRQNSRGSFSRSSSVNNGRETPKTFRKIFILTFFKNMYAFTFIQQISILIVF